MRNHKGEIIYHYNLFLFFFLFFFSKKGKANNAPPNPVSPPTPGHRPSSPRVSTRKRPRVLSRRAADDLHTRTPHPHHVEVAPEVAQQLRVGAGREVGAARYLELDFGEAGPVGFGKKRLVGCSLFCAGFD